MRLRSRPQLNRRQFMAGSAGLAAIALSGVGDEARAQLAAGAAQALASSELIYLSPLRSDGSLSRCQAEVWFAYSDGDVFVVTANDAWRAQAVGRGLQATQLWVGDVGQWASSDGAYLRLPSLRADASLVTDIVAQAKVLEVMGGKYQREWSSWGPRFRNGLANGSRVMLRYRLA